MKSFPNWTVWALFSLLFLYNILDAYHTILLLQTGLIYEVNPIMNYFIKNYGQNSLYGVKCLTFIWLGFFLLIERKEFNNE